MKFGMLLILITAIISCDSLPRDPQGTLAMVMKTQIIRAGVSHDPPWIQAIDTTKAPGGIEVEILQQFAETLGVRIEWTHNTEQELIHMLEGHELDIVLTGMTADTPWKENVGLTRPYYRGENKKHVLAIPSGENAWLMALEKFIEDNSDLIEQTIAKSNRVI